MNAVQSYRDLVVWQRAMELVERGYRLTAAFPSEERFGLTSQLRRALVSVASNIAEGHNSLSTPVYLRHLSTALGSQAEAETQLELCIRLGFADRDHVRPLIEIAGEVGRMLHALVRSLRQRNAP